MNIKEKWIPICGYESNYIISNHGNVKSLNYNGIKGKERLLKPAQDKKGYMRVALSNNIKLKTFKIHRLVAEHFILNQENKPCVNHIDCNKTNNNVLNLEWCTYKENTAHAIKNGIFVFQTPEKSTNKNIKHGELNGFSILKENQVIEIRKKYKKRVYTRKMLAIEYGVTESCIKDVISKKSWQRITVADHQSLI